MRQPVLLALALFAGPALAQDEASLRSADAAQQVAAGANDGAALIEMTHPNFRLYAPEGYIGDRDRLTKRFKSAETGYVQFDRTVDSLAVTGAVGIVMGREIVARRDQQPLARRFTNVWIWEGGRWLWLARHAQQLKD